MTLEENIVTPEDTQDDAITFETIRAAAREPHQEIYVSNERDKPVRDYGPHVALRVILQLLSFVVCLALLATMLVGALVLDLQQLTSAGGLNMLIDAVISSMTAPAQPQAAAPQLSRLSNWTVRYEDSETTVSDYSIYVDEDGNTVIVDENGNVVDGGSVIIDENGNMIIGNIDPDDIPEDILTGGNSEENMGNLVDWIYDQVAESAGGELDVSKEQVQNFVEQSTVSDYLSDKLAGFAQDFINGTQETTITADELMGLLEENEALLQSEFGIELTPDVKQELQSSMEQMVEESDINNVIREEVFGSVEDALEESTQSLGVDMAQIREILQLITSESTRNLVIIVNVSLILLLVLLNYYNIPAGLTWAAFPTLLAGGILQLPVMVLQNIDASSETPSAIASLLASFAEVFRPIHSAVLYLGVGLLVVSILWRIIRAVIRKVRANQA